MTSLAQFRDCHSCYDERSIDQKKGGLVVEIHQRLGVPQISQGTVGPNVSHLALGTAADGTVTQGRPEYMPSGRGLRGLLPPGLGSRRRIPTCVALVKASLSKTECRDAYSWLRYVPNRLYLQWPKGPSTQGQYLCYFTLGRMTLFRWTVVFMPIIHACQHNHLSPWAMICWMTSHMASFARRPLRAECDWYVVVPVAEHGPSSVGSQSPMRQCLCGADPKS